MKIRMVAEVCAPGHPWHPIPAMGLESGQFGSSHQSPMEKTISIISQRYSLPLGMCGGPTHPGADTWEGSADPSRVYW